jgi:uncharacterized membrane protein YedE/YeeE
MTESPILFALAGGAIIGLASALLMGLNGRIAGISGILGGLVVPHRNEFAWRLFFVLGLSIGGAIMMWTVPGSIAFDVERSTPALIIAGLLVGFGTRLGSGCTSGHGVCGLSRMSQRSFASVMSFMVTGAVVAFLTRVLFGGNL